MWWSLVGGVVAAVGEVAMVMISSVGSKEHRPRPCMNSTFKARLCVGAAFDLAMMGRSVGRLCAGQGSLVHSSARSQVPC